MKIRVVWQYPVCVGLAVLTLGSGCRRSASDPSRGAAGTESAVSAAPASTPSASADSDASAEAAIAGASFHSISTDSPLPSAVRSTGSVADVIKMANAGMDAGTMLAFINISTTPFGPNAEEIIYLNDIGVPAGVVTAMFQRDEFLKDTPLAPIPLPQFGNAPEVAASPPPVIQPAFAVGNSAPLDPSSEQEDALASPPVEAVDPEFYDTLAPYGSWVDVAGCGPCWQPAVAVANPAWQPYLDGGHWVFTDSGCYWLSD